MAARFSPAVVPRAASASAPERRAPRPPDAIELDREGLPVPALALPSIVDSRFPRSARVRASAEYDRVFKQGRRTAAPMMSLHWLGEDIPPRLGLAVSRKVDPNAVGRNRIKRALRDQFRLQRGRIAPGSFVVVARPIAAKADGLALRNALMSLLQRAGALLPMDAPGTMPSAHTPPASSSTRSAHAD